MILCLIIGWYIYSERTMKIPRDVHGEKLNILPTRYLLTYSCEYIEAANRISHIKDSTGWKQFRFMLRPMTMPSHRPCILKHSGKSRQFIQNCNLILTKGSTSAKPAGKGKWKHMLFRCLGKGHLPFLPYLRQSQIWL